MELYHRYPRLCTFWAFAEILCFGGIIFGWGSLVFVLKEEGFYSEVCEINKNINSNQTQTFDRNDISIYNINRGNATTGSSPNYLGNAETYLSNAFPKSTNDSSDHIRGTKSGTEENYVSDRERSRLKVTCVEQEARLNLWFSIAVGFMYLSFAVIGFINRKLGTMLTRVVFMLIFVCGTMAIAFASPEVPWLLLPGLCCVGTCGLVIFSTNIQVATLFPRLRSTVVATFTGMFDLSSIVQQFVKIGYEGNIPRRYSYIFISILFLLMVGTSTAIFLPRDFITQSAKADDEERQQKKKKLQFQNGTTDKVGHTDKLLENGKADDTINGIPVEKEENRFLETPEEKDIPSLCATLLSLTCILHLYWVCIHALRFVTFIGLLNVWLENILHQEDRVSMYLGHFSYITLGAICTALFAGFLFDWQRRSFVRSSKLKRQYRPVILPMMLVMFYSVVTTVLSMIEHEAVPYISFTVFTFMRSSLWTVAVAFIGEAFPMHHFAVLFGFVQFAAGIAGLLQYAVFEWFEAYVGSSTHVNITLLVLQISTLLHPLLMWVCSRPPTPTGEVNLYNTEFTVQRVEESPSQMQEEAKSTT